jgi:hypothetical protein
MESRLAFDGTTPFLVNGASSTLVLELSDSSRASSPSETARRTTLFQPIHARPRHVGTR